MTLKLQLLETQLAQALQGTCQGTCASDSFLTENTQLKAKNADLKKKFVDVTQQMIDELFIEVDKSNWLKKFKLGKKVCLLSSENNTQNEKLKVVSQTGHKGKGHGSDLQFELEVKINKPKLDLTTLLERNIKLERDLVLIKDDLKKSLRWIASSETISYLAKIRPNTKISSSERRRKYIKTQGNSK